MRKILVTDAGYKHTLGIVRAFGKEGFIVDLVGEDNSISAYSKYANKVVFHQSQFNQGSIDQLISFLKANRYDLLLPVSAKSVQFVSQNKELIAKYSGVVVAEIELIEKCLNKDETFSELRSIGISMPSTWVFQSFDELEKSISDINLPVVVKSKNEFGKIDPKYIYTTTQLLRTVASYYSDQGAFPLIQEYIEGDGYGFFALYKNGICQSYFMHKRVREYPATGGASTCALSVYDSILLHEGSKILDHMRWHGVAMVEFKKSRHNGKYYLIEINPKFWGSHDLALESGVNFPMEVYKLAIGNRTLPAAKTTYSIGLKYHWPIEGEIEHFADRPSSLLNILFDCINPFVHSNIHFNDLQPNLYSLKNQLRLKNLAHLFLKDTEIVKIFLRSRHYGFRLAFARSFSERTGIQLRRYSMVEDALYIGCQHGAIGKLLLRLSGVRSSLNLRHEFNDVEEGLAFPEHCRIPIIEYTTPSMDQLIKSISFITSNVSQNKKIFIHCSEGVSRAAMVGAAYFVSRGLSVENAIEKIRAVRPFINILPDQKQSLITLSAQIRAKKFKHLVH